MKKIRTLKLGKILLVLTKKSVLREFKRINELLFPLKSSENHKFFDGFRGDGS